MIKNYLSKFTYLTYYGEYDFSHPRRSSQEDEGPSGNQVERGCKKGLARTSTQTSNYGRAYKEQQAHRRRRKRDRRQNQETNSQKAWLVIDTNRIIAALIKDSISRKILLENHFYTPEHTHEEVKKYEELILDKSGLTKKELDTLLTILFSKIKTIHSREYQEQILQAEKEINDDKDVVFVALAIAKQANIWSDDKDFNTVTSVKVLTTKELLENT